MIIFFSMFLKFLSKGSAVGPITKVNLALGFFSNKELKTPLDKTVSPIKFEQIINIFTGNTLQILN